MTTYQGIMHLCRYKIEESFVCSYHYVFLATGDKWRQFDFDSSFADSVAELEAA